MKTDNWKGMSSSTMKESVTLDRVKAFQKATHTNCEEDTIPPTYVTRFRQTEFELFDMMGVSLSQVLHGEQLYHYFDDLKVGDEIEYQSTIRECKEKSGKSGTMIFVHIGTDFIRLSDRKKLADSDSTIIVRVPNEN